MIHYAHGIIIKIILHLLYEPSRDKKTKGTLVGGDVYNPKHKEIRNSRHEGRCSNGFPLGRTLSLRIGCSAIIIVERVTLNEDWTSNVREISTFCAFIETRKRLLQVFALFLSLSLSLRYFPIEVYIIYITQTSRLHDICSCRKKEVQHIFSNTWNRTLYDVI